VGYYCIFMTEEKDNSVVRRMPVECGPSWINDIKLRVGRYLNRRNDE
jgi:hypothetical protein